MFIFMFFFVVIDGFHDNYIIVIFNVQLFVEVIDGFNESSRSGGAGVMVFFVTCDGVIVGFIWMLGVLVYHR